MASAPFVTDVPIERPEQHGARVDDSFVEPYPFAKLDANHADTVVTHSTDAHHTKKADPNSKNDPAVVNTYLVGGGYGTKAVKARRDPAVTNAYLIGGGIASLAAAAHLIHDARVPASQIHILESSPLPGGSMDGSGNPDTGYILRGGRMLNFSYLCLYDLLSTIPSLTNQHKTVMDEIHEFNAIQGNKTHSLARLVTRGLEGPEIVDSTKMGLHGKDKLDLVKITLESEKALGQKKIAECFEPSFFHTNFWFMWSTM